MNKPLLVGLTGGIGSGKSTIAKVFESLEVPVFNSDVVAKNIMNNDTEVINNIVAQFGAVYVDGKLDKLKMASIVFNDKTTLEQLNKIVHPKVAKHFENWIEQSKTEPILIKESAILIESGAHKQMDKIILVTAPERIRIQRVIQRDNTSEQKVKERIKAQLPDEEKKTYADFVIINNDEQLVTPQVLEVMSDLNI